MTIHTGSGRAFRRILAYGVILLFTPALQAGFQADRVSATSPLKAIWSFSVPLKLTAKIESYHLLDGYLYAIGNDGKVRCIRADSGEFMWTVAVGEPMEKIWPPIAYRSADFEAVGFGLLDEAVFIEPQSGLVTKRFELTSPLTGGLAAGDKAIFATSADRSVSRYDIKDGWPHWQIATRDVLFVAPIFLWGNDLVVTADESGRITGTDSSKHHKFVTKLEGSPRGWLGLDSTAIYVATADESPKLHALNRHTGKALREPYRLSGPPQGGPVVTERSVYQATMPTGLHRVGLAAEGRNWYQRSAKLFLAEWAGQTAVLTVDGQIALVDAKSSEPNVIVSSERYTTAVSNPYNDIIIVATDRGQIRCYRPTGAPLLDLATFHPTTQPAQTQPAEAKKAPEPSPATILTTVRPASARPAKAEKKLPAQAATPPQVPPNGQQPPSGPTSVSDRLKNMLQNAMPPQNQPQRPPQNQPPPRSRY